MKKILTIIAILPPAHNLCAGLGRFILLVPTICREQISTLIIAIFFPLATLSQVENADQYIYSIKKAASAITVDGIVDEPAWKKAEIIKDFFQHAPYDTGFAVTKTEVRLTYDDKNIYISAICYDTFPGDFVVSSLKRDFSYSKNDAFAVYFDPFGDQTNGFNFTVSPLGVQREGLIANKGIFGVTTSWDNKWFSKVINHADKWIVEMSIPFKSIRYPASGKENTKNWRINFSRNNLKINENSCWAPVPRNFNIAYLGFTGKLIWDAAPKKAGTNISIIPYTLARINEDFEGTMGIQRNYNMGLDAKIAVTSSLNLDLTINPDFSQVEVDQQITNLTRFSLFFPEKRNFFIENSDLFGDFGFRQIRPFFSRKIGLYQGQVIPIIAGARLSGKVNKNWRIGIMDMQTKGKSELDLKPQNYFVGAFQRQVFSQSNVGMIFVNRQAFDNTSIIVNDYNRILGLQYNLASKDNKIGGRFFYQQAFTPDNLKDQQTHASFLSYNTQNIKAMWNHEYVGENFIADVGFVPRQNHYDAEKGTTIRRAYWRLEPSFQYKFYPKKSKKILAHAPKLYVNNYYDGQLKTTDQFYQIGYTIAFLNTSAIVATFNYSTTQLLFPTDITGTGSTPLPAGKYEYQNANIVYVSDSRKKFNIVTGLAYGSFYNGTVLGFGADVNYRAQPWGIFSLNYRMFKIELPDPFAKVALHLIGAKLELSFTKSLFFTNFIQYNTQANNFNINSRLQWRFKPLSDLYLVYTDNYNTPDFRKRNRAFVLKFIYWI